MWLLFLLVGLVSADCSGLGPATIELDQQPPYTIASCSYGACTEEGDGHSFSGFCYAYLDMTRTIDVFYYDYYTEDFVTYTSPGAYHLGDGPDSTPTMVAITNDPLPITMSNLSCIGAERELIGSNPCPQSVLRLPNHPPIGPGMQYNGLPCEFYLEGVLDCNRAELNDASTDDIDKLALYAVRKSLSEKDVVVNITHINEHEAGHDRTVLSVNATVVDLVSGTYTDTAARYELVRENDKYTVSSCQTLWGEEESSTDQDCTVSDDWTEMECNHLWCTYMRLIEEPAYGNGQACPSTGHRVVVTWSREKREYFADGSPFDTYMILLDPQWTIDVVAAGASGLVGLLGIIKLIYVMYS